MEIKHIVILIVLGLLAVVILSFRKSPGQFIAALWIRLTTMIISLGGAALSFLYIIWPIDLVPDIIVFFGWLDDLGALGIGIHFLKKAFTFPAPFGKSDKEND